MKTTRLTRIGLAVMGVLLLASLALMVFSKSGSNRLEANRPNDGRHCPDCGRELSKEALVTGVCPYCKAEEAAEGDAPKKKRGKGSLASSPLIPAAIFGAFFLLLVVHLVIVARTRLHWTKEELLFYTNCRKCTRKLRYRERQVGHLARCPICRTPIVFPRPEGVHRRRWPAAVWQKITGR
jgi:predicted Zn-ribbon and HTH transcriptional regulator